MKTKNLFLSLTIASLFLLSCSKEDEVTSKIVTSKYVTIYASMANSTKATDTAFDSEDVIGVYSWTGEAGTISDAEIKKDYTYNGSLWSTPSPMVWSDLTTANYFMGVFPNREISSFTEDPFMINLNDREASDLLIATNVTGINGATTDPVSLVFSHVMAKLTINLNYTEWKGTPTVTSVKVPATSSGKINYLTKIITPSTIDETDIISIPAVTANTSYSSIMIPQTITHVSIIIGKKNYVYTLTEAVSLTSGTNLILNLTVKHEGEVKLESSISINEWTTRNIDDVVNVEN